MKYNVQIGYRKWVSRQASRFISKITGSVEQDSESIEFKKNAYADLYADFESAKVPYLYDALFEYMSDELNGLIDAMVVRIGDAEFHGIKGFMALEEVAAGSTPYEIVRLYDGILLA